MEQTGIFRTVGRFWNGPTATGDALPGQSVAGYPGQPPQYIGQLGAFAYLNFSDAQKRSDSAAAQSLQGGRYQYVQYAASGTAYAVGQVLYWSDETNYIVTNVAPSAVSARIAGICLSIVGQGNYWLIQTDGVANVLFRAAVTSTVADNVVSVVINTNTADALADATAVTDSVLKLYIGTAKAAPANSTVSTVYLRGLVQVQ